MKTILITGATDGIGLETAKKLVMQGHPLLVHGRNQTKLDHLVGVLSELNPKVQVQSYIADMSDLHAVQAMTRRIVKEQTRLDVIINNAGVYKTAKPMTLHGVDVRFVVNTLAPYVVVESLRSILASDGRIVNLSSAAQSSVNLNALTGKQFLNDDFEAYAQSKLALTIWSQMLSESFHDAEVVLAVNPGSLLASKMVKEGFGVAGNDISIGANILVRASLSDEFKDASGRYYDNDSKQLKAPHKQASDRRQCEQIVEQISELASRLLNQS